MEKKKNILMIIGMMNGMNKEEKIMINAHILLVIYYLNPVL